MIALLASLVLALPADPPNVLVVLVDDAGTEVFGCTGGTAYPTPNIDALADSGVLFEHAYSQPLCTPSRVKILTGRSNLRNYVHFSILDRDERTFAHLAREAGYRTCAAGKWQLLGAEHYDEWAGTGTHPRDAGFERWCLWQVEGLGSRFWDPVVEVDGVLHPKMEGRFGPDVYVDYLLELFEEHRDERFLAFYPMALVHSPFVHTPHSEDGDRQQNFAAMVAYMDHLMGRLVEGLERLGIRDETLILFTSDNGTDRKITTDGEKGGKGRSTDAGTRVPLIASWPAAVAGGRVSSDLVDFSDVLPTIAEAIGAPLPRDRAIDGRSFLPQLLGERGNPRRYITCYSNPRPERANFPRARFARDQRFKLYADGRFYDVAADPKEEEALELDGLEPDAAGTYAVLRHALSRMPDEPPRLRTPGPPRKAAVDG